MSTTEDISNYEIAKLLVTSYVNVMTPNEIQTLIPPTVDITSKKQVKRHLRFLVLSNLLNSEHKKWFTDLTKKQLATILDLPIQSIPQQILKDINENKTNSN